MTRRPATIVDRRSFLRRAGVAALVAPAAPLLACAGERGEAGAAPSGGDHATGDVTRPILLPLSDDAVWMDAPAREMPAAYVSMGTRRLFVDRAFRDQVYWDLRAHISVSTEVWRIPLAGDSPREAVMPGDALREFEELSEREWDPTAVPTPGDIRIMRGTAVSRRVDIVCAPLAGGGAWFRAGPWDILQCGGPTEGLCREDFMSVGTGMRYADRDCTRPRGEVDFLTWACPPAIP
jgi:hypothetical protein